jgi:hypothetical protein
MLSNMIPELWPVYDPTWRSAEDRIRFAWVQGSILGAYYGTPICVLLGLAWLVGQQVRQRREALVAE